MKNDKLEKILIDLGLSENEAKVYLTALNLGSSTILKIARAAETKRTTVYSVIESLKQKGLMNIELKGWKKLFVAESPEKLDFILESSREELKKSLPELMGMYNLKGGESFMKYYEGLESVKSVYEGLIKDIKPHENYMVIADQEMWFNLDKKYFRDFIKRRSKLNINCRLIFRDSKIAREHKKNEKNVNATIRLLPKEVKFHTDIVVTPQKVVFHQLTPPIMAIVIENKSIIKVHQEMFEIIWNSIE